MARGRHFQSFKSLLSQTKSPDEIVDLYQSLNLADPLLDDSNNSDNFENDHLTTNDK